MLNIVMISDLVSYNVSLVNTAFDIITLSTIILSIMTLSIMALSIMTLDIMNDTEHNDP
jgi:hypothetical protein